MSSKSKTSGRKEMRIVPVHNFRVTGMGIRPASEGSAAGRIDIHLPDIGIVVAMSDNLAAQLRDDIATNLNDLDSLGKI